jgi:transposase
MSSNKKFGTIKRIGIDLSKNTLQMYGEDGESRKVLERGISRRSVLSFTANLSPCSIAMESCGSSHYWGREFMQQGHTVELIPAQYVKPFVKSHKNDRLDAEAICEASTRPNKRLVPVKSIEQQDIQSLHRVRQNITKNRTALSNQIRGLLGEYGIVMPEGISNVFSQMPSILEDAENHLSSLIREVLKEQFEELQHIDERFESITKKIEDLAASHPLCLRLMTLEGIGPLTATALYAAVGNGRQFRKGRHMSAWLGVVPKQYSTGGRSRLGRISKHGNSYIRSLMVGGARAVVQYANKKETRLSKWICTIKEKKGYNVAVIALVNKNLRVAWALLTKGEDYDITRQEQLAKRYEKAAA